MAKNINRKAKGTVGERELMHKFWDKGWACVRVAGSGSGKHPSCDLVAGNRHRKLAIECKTIGNQNVYISKEQIALMRQFSDIFGAESYVAVRFPGDGWYFLSLDDLKECKANYAVTNEAAKAKGFILDELIGETF